MMEIPEKPYFSASEVARLLLVSTNSVRVWSNKGLLKAELTLGRHRRFPRSEIVRLIQERQARSAPVQPDGLRILIIDDDEVFAAILTQGLQQAMPGTVVTLATDGFSGGMLARSAHPQIILLDLRMPGMDGFQTCTILKADPTTRHIRIIAISGSLDASDGPRIREAGAEVLLAKPVPIPALLEAIHGLRPAGMRS